MSALLLAMPARICDETPMGNARAQRSSSIFEQEATETVGALKRALANIVAALGVRRAGELQRLLKLDTTLVYQIFRVIAERDVLAAGPSIPSRVSIDRFSASASRSGTPLELIDTLNIAYVDFEGLVEKHAGDRTSFNSLVTGVAGINDEWLNADLQHRRNMFRGLSHVLGFQSKAAFVSNFLAPFDDHRWQAAVVMGSTGLRVLRSIDQVCVHGVETSNDTESDGFAWEHQPLALTGSPDSYFLEQFSTCGRPRLKIESGKLEKHSWAQTLLQDPEVGNVGMTTVLFGEKMKAPKSLDVLSHLVSTPCEVLVQDLLIQPGMMQGPPTLSVFMGNDRPTHRPQGPIALLGKHSIDYLGRGAGAVALPELPEYRQLATSVANEMGFDIETFEVWRVRLEFPVYKSTSQITFTPNPSEVVSNMPDPS